MSALYPINLSLAGRRVLLVGGGTVATHKVQALLEAGARVHVVAPVIAPALARAVESVAARAFEPSDLIDVSFVVSAAPPDVNRAVSEAAHARKLFVLAVDQPACGSAQSPAIVRRAGLTVAISTEGAAPALAGLVRQALEALLPDDADAARWLDVARRARDAWKSQGAAHADRRPLLLAALDTIYREKSS